MTAEEKRAVRRRLIKIGACLGFVCGILGTLLAPLCAEAVEVFVPGLQGASSVVDSLVEFPASEFLGLFPDKLLPEALLYPGTAVTAGINSVLFALAGGAWGFGVERAWQFQQRRAAGVADTARQSTGFSLESPNAKIAFYVRHKDTIWAFLVGFAIGAIIPMAFFLCAVANLDIGELCYWLLIPIYLLFSVFGVELPVTSGWNILVLLPAYGLLFGVTFMGVWMSVKMVAKFIHVENGAHEM